jgi:hypothetical protein
MSPQQRSAMIEAFKTNANITVFLISLKVRRFLCLLFFPHFFSSFLRVLSFNACNPSAFLSLSPSPHRYQAGGVALNLTEASRVFIMDPWWNSAVEDQVCKLLAPAFLPAECANLANLFLFCFFC